VSRIVLTAVVPIAPARNRTPQSTSSRASPSLAVLGALVAFARCPILRAARASQRLEPPAERLGRFDGGAGGAGLIREQPV
jgi:hypothetical protein